MSLCQRLTIKLLFTINVNLLFLNLINKFITVESDLLNIVIAHF